MTPLEKFKQRLKASEKDGRDYGEKASDLLGGQYKPREEKSKRETANERMVREANEASKSLSEKRKKHEEDVNDSWFKDGGIVKPRGEKKHFCKLIKMLESKK